MLSPSSGRVVLFALVVMLVAATVAGSTFTVTTTWESPTSLRQAIVAANASPGADRIEFAIPGPDFIIEPLTPLPPITDAVTIDGTTQPGYSGTPVVAIHGLPTRPNPVLVLEADEIVVAGLAINGATTAIAVRGNRAVIRSCHIGLDAGGTSAVPNETGIDVTGSFNQIGGAGAGEGNLIAGNALALRLHAGASGNFVRGNIIGLDRNWLDVGNDEGIVLVEAHGNTLESNIIQATRSSAIRLEMSDGNVIGSLGARNWLWGNFGDAVSIGSGSGNTVRGNLMYVNSGLGIDLGPDGVNPNDPLDVDTGANGLQNHPLLTGIVPDGLLARVDGTLDSAPNTTYTIDLYDFDVECLGQGTNHVGSITTTTDSAGHADFSLLVDQSLLWGPQTATATDPAGNTSEGSPCLSGISADLAMSAPAQPVLEVGVAVPVVYTVHNNGPMHATDVNVWFAEYTLLESATPSQGSCSGNLCSIPLIPAGQSVTITVLYRAAGPGNVSLYGSAFARERDPDLGNNSAWPYAYVAATYVVDSAADHFDAMPGDGICADAMGACTLRAALLEAANSPAPDRVHFAIGSGPQTISLTNGTLYLTDTIAIDATTQPGYAGAPLITIDGALAGPWSSGFAVLAGRAAVKGLTITRFDTAISFEGGEGHLIAGNYIGTDGVFSDKYSVIRVFAPGVTVENNVIAGQVFAGTPAAGMMIRQNRIGTDATGTQQIGPMSTGIFLRDVSGTVVEDNVIGSSGGGVLILGSAATGNRIERNHIGVAADGTTPLPNSGPGIAISRGRSNVVAGNTIAFSNPGILMVGSADGNTVRGNSIFANTLGIDLGTPGPTPNDPGDIDGGPNSLQNTPVLTLARSADGVTTVFGSIDTTPATTIMIELFLDAECDASGYGQGRTPIGDITVITDSTGHAEISAAFALAVTSPMVMTATATNSSGSTSEFSACTPVVLNRPPVAMCRDAAVSAGGSCTAVVSVGDVDDGSFDPDGDALTATLAPAGPFQAGTTPVQLTVSDGRGGTATCTATVTVVDDTLPEVTCPADVDMRLEYGQTSAAVSYDPPVATDNCPATVTSCDIASGSLFPAGTTLVTCTSIDASGNAMYCTFRVTLVSAAAAALKLGTAVQDLVDAGAVSAGNGTALIAKIDAALDALEQGNRTAAVNQIEAFIAHVEALVRGGQLSASNGDALIKEAGKLREQLT